MVGNIPTDTEKTILKELVGRSCAAVPGCKVRFVRRVQEPGEQGLLLGLQLPSEIRTNSTEIFKLQDICELQSRDCNLPIGLTVSQQPNKNGLLDLEFLPSEVVAPPDLQVDDKQDSQTVIVTAAVIVLLILAGYFLFKPKSDFQMANTNNHVSPKVEPTKQEVIAQPPRSSSPPLIAPQPINNPNEPIAIFAPPKSQVSSKQEAYVQMPGARDEQQPDLWIKDNPSKEQALPGIDSWNAHLPPKIEKLEGPPSRHLEQVVQDQTSESASESSSRKEASNELYKYEALLRLKGRIEEADQVKKMILELP